MSAIRISSPGLPVRGRCVVTSSPGTSTRVVIPGRCSVPCVRVAVLATPVVTVGRCPLTVPVTTTVSEAPGYRHWIEHLVVEPGSRRGCPAVENPWSEQDVQPRGLLITVIVIVLTVPLCR